MACAQDNVIDLLYNGNQVMIKTLTGKNNVCSLIQTSRRHEDFIKY